MASPLKGCTVFWIMLTTLSVVLIIALGLMAVVAISNGHLGTRGNVRLERAVDSVNRHLNGEGTPPRFLERLDRER